MQIINYIKQYQIRLSNIWGSAPLWLRLWWRSADPTLPANMYVSVTHWKKSEDREEYTKKANAVFERMKRKEKENAAIH